jgi:ubiquitin-protein ligase
MAPISYVTLPLILTNNAGGLYHFRILLPAEYPFRPPAIQLLTPNGRFDLNTNVRCILCQTQSDALTYDVDMYLLHKLP